MPSCCGGSSTGCDCVVQSGPGISVTGVGTPAAPYVIRNLGTGEGVDPGDYEPAVVSDDIPLPSSPVPLAGSSDEISRSDHVHPSAGLYGWYGDGSMGNVTLDGSTTPSGFSRSGSVYVPNGRINCLNLTINAGVTLKPSGQIINVKDTLSGSGSIAADYGKLGYNIRYANLGAGGVAPATGTGAGASGNNTNDGMGVYATSGAGGLGSSGAGGSGATNNTEFTQFMLRDQCRDMVTAFTGIFHHFDWAQANPSLTAGSLRGGSSGGSGGGDGTNPGGAGGAGGQVVIVNARKIIGTIAISANGQAGGSVGAGNAGGGGGGTGGIAILNCVSNTGWSGTVTANGGAGGTKNGTGVNGNAGGAGHAVINVWT